MNTTAKYPQIVVRLVGGDGNAFAVLGNVKRALQNGRVPKEEIDAFVAEATSGDYWHLLATVTNWVSVDADDDEPVAWYGALDDEDEDEYDDED